jgi:uncharacterized protein YacL
MLAPNTVLWASTLLVLSFTPYVMKTLNYGPLMALAVAIALLCILTDGVATLLMKRANGSELNPIMNLLFRKVGLHYGLFVTRLVGLALVAYAVFTYNPYMILGISWLFLLAGFVGLSSIALSSKEHYQANAEHRNH